MGNPDFTPFFQFRHLTHTSHIDREKLDICKQYSSILMCTNLLGLLFWGHLHITQTYYIFWRLLFKVYDDYFRVLFPSLSLSEWAVEQTTGNCSVLINPTEVAAWCLITKQALALDCWTTFLPEVLGEPVVCPLNTNWAKLGWNGWRDALKNGGMQGRKMFSVSSTQGISLLEEFTQPTENLFRHC